MAPPYPPDLVQQIIELVRAGRAPEELSREFELPTQMIHDWLRQAERDEERRVEGLISGGHAELGRPHGGNGPSRQGTDVPAEATRNGAWQGAVNLDLLWGRIEQRMGVCPSFFRLARHEPPIAEALFGLAEFAYLDNPIPSLFKEQLFTYLSRFCPVTYCMARHGAFLLGRGTVAGDQDVRSVDMSALRQLLDEPVPSDEALTTSLETLEGMEPIIEWPAWDSELGRDLRFACVQIFLHGHRESRWVFALQRLLGRARYEQLALFLGFIRMAHFWTEVHPELESESDVHELLREHEALAASLSAGADGETASSERLWRELADLRRQAESVRQLRELADALPAYIAYLDTAQCYAFANKTYTTGFGLGQDEIVGKPVREVLSERGYRLVQPHLEAALRGGRVRLDIRLPIPRVGERDLDVSYVPDRRPDGSVAGCFVLAIDITERKRAEEELGEAGRAKDEFLAVLGHELRNPLAPMATGLDLLQWARNQPELIDTVRPMMKRQLIHLTRLVDDLLDASRLTRGQIALQAAALDLRDAVAAAVEQCKPLIDERHHALTVEIPKDPVPVHGDFQRLTQVVSNLLTNAANYTQPGGQITVNCDARAEEAIVRVRDTGFGIPPERIGDLFHMFKQVPEHSPLVGGGGLGIGLALSRQLIELHGGSIRAASEGLGYGSEFTVRLPLVSHAGHDGAQEAAASAATQADRRRVLVVDDNVDAAHSLQMLLEFQGHDVRAVHDGIAALETAAHFRPEVVLLDIGLPGMDGLEAARRIRAMPDGHRVVLVALTGWGQQEDIQRTRDAGFDDHLTKPVDLGRLGRLLAGEVAG